VKSMKNIKEISAQVGENLINKDCFVAVAESCTGGLVSAALTDVPGSSKYFGYGLVTYSNKAKVQLLGVREITLELFGAVSAETAGEMAEGIGVLSGSDYGIAVTGIAGPGGGSPDKPVGLVYVGVCGKDMTETSRFKFEGDRQEIRNKSVEAALNTFLEFLQRYA